MAADSKQDELALQMVKQLQKELLQQGRYTFAPAIGKYAAVQPAAGIPATGPNLAGFGSADLDIFGIGYEKGGSGDRSKVHIYVTKGSLTDLRRYEGDATGVPIEIHKIGRLIIKPEVAKGANRNGNHYRYGGRVACGSSCAPTGENYSGTFGALVRSSGGQLFMMSNNHVLSACNHADIGTPIMSPSNMDGRAGLAPTEIGRHTMFIELRSGQPDVVQPCRVDAALAEVVDEARVTSWQGDDVYGYDTPAVVAEPQAGTVVKKFGRSTGLTRGILQALLPIGTAFPYSSGQFTATVWFQHIWVVQLLDKHFALLGDSGSLVVSDDGQQAIGILFAVSNNGKCGFVLPINDIFAEFANLPNSSFGGLELVAGHGV